LERREGVWRALDAKGALLGEAPVAVLACGPAIAAVGRLGVLPMRAVSGQIEWGPAASAPATALTGDGYVAPFAGGIVFGATFQRGADPLGAATACADGRAENLARLAALDPACAAGLDLLKLQSRAGLRAVLPDHAPIAGALEPGLYALGGFGARGITLAPLLAEATAAMAFQEPALLSLAAEKALSPLRFVRTKHG
jgi:tRNA 5-methylaminomethyl-2-thiouridine biosynthesis bifunctional protein